MIVVIETSESSSDVEGSSDPLDELLDKELLLPLLSSSTSETFFIMVCTYSATKLVIFLSNVEPHLHKDMMNQHSKVTLIPTVLNEQEKLAHVTGRANRVL